MAHLGHCVASGLMSDYASLVHQFCDLSETDEHADGQSGLVRQGCAVWEPIGDPKNGLASLVGGQDREQWPATSAARSCSSGRT